MGAQAALSQAPARAILPQGRRHPFFESFLWQLAKVRSGIHEAPADIRFAPPVAPGRRVPSVIERLGEFAARTNLPVVIVRLELEARTESAADRRLRREALQRGLHYVDTRGPFRDIDTRPFWIYELDPHPNAQAHAVFAEVIGGYLADADLVPAVCENPAHHHE
jgi:hypothetical protein